MNKTRTYDVRDFHAAGDGKTKDTAAIQDAIDKCSEAGGGIVLLAGGTFVSGTLYLKSNVFLEIDASAILLASPDIEDYGADTHRNRYRNETNLDRCFLYAEDAENVGIYGYGEINGNAGSFPNAGSIYRPMMMRFLRCKSIHLSDVRLYDAAAWTTAFLDSEYIWVRGVDISNEKRYNGDGLDFDGCSHIYVSDCHIKGTDDNLCLQSSDKKHPVQNVHITNCDFTSLCAAIRIGLKSIGSISDVTIQNCTMRNVWREGIKIECTEGGNITDIVISNIVMHNVSRPIFAILNNRFEPEGYGSSISLTETPEIGTMKRIYISNLLATDDDEMKNTHMRFTDDVIGCPKFSGIRFDAEQTHPIEDIILSHIHYTFVGGVRLNDIPVEYPQVLDKKIHSDTVVSENYYPDWSRAAFMDLRNIKNLELESISLRTLYTDERPPVIIESCMGVYQNLIRADTNVK